MERAFFLKYGNPTARPGLFMRNGRFWRLGGGKMYYQNPAEDALVLKFKFP